MYVFIGEVIIMDKLTVYLLTMSYKPIKCLHTANNCSIEYSVIHILVVTFKKSPKS